MLLVRVRIKTNAYDEADRLLAEVFRFKPNNPEALYLSGLISLARGDTAKTLGIWQDALDRAVNKGRSR